ncbi:hypothetical protein [Campylobacter hyointestinalis]|uniref:Uncharacterized protein n=1 Tax=Campylobacter hyointestinalis subsp. hyointestinalis TaxID=91352 RepID=A0A9W5EQT9_CAMHY|nr:hypothetical protein [Campylobacter hyointestinalis]CUU75297.1 Uncharacterised protein [Campylobacter hyointestinalis subsp. hyointestinalis]CUU82648.1 Uncharacterised protein [Campylobacter hyointestinalis subsp. hyointestinalis]
MMILEVQDKDWNEIKSRVEQLDLLCDDIEEAMEAQDFETLADITSEMIHLIRD